jgi:hypothetical protein
LDAELRGRMERLGLQRAAAFTWKKSARATLDVYKEVVNATRQAAPRKNRAATAAAGGRKR